MGNTPKARCNATGIRKPKNIDKMVDLATKLAKDFPYFVRTDFYEIDDKVLFSEFTFFSDNGMAPFHPKCWDKKLGELIHLPIDKNKKA